MSTSEFVMAFLPELVLLGGSLVLFVIALGADAGGRARAAALIVGVLATGASAVALRSEALLFDGAYRVDGFSQWLKLVFTGGATCVVLMAGRLEDIRKDIRAEYFLFLMLAVVGLVLVASAVELVALVVSLELSSFALILMVPMRRERDGQRSQMESAVKYIMFGVAANGVMLFGLSFLYGLTGTTQLAVMAERIQPMLGSPLAITGLALAFAGVYYKLAVFPFHFWTPDVYQGASNETAGLIASLPKVGAIVVFVRLASLAMPESETLVLVLSVLAVASMLYGNLLALGQSDFKRLLGFSGIAHAGYALLGFVALDEAGFAAALYYSTGYVAMVLACFVVISRVSRDGVNVAIADLAGLHRRSRLLAATLLVGVFALAGLPPFVGFMGKLSLLTAALAKGHLVLVVVAVLNAAVAIYYYLRVVKEAFFTNAPEGGGETEPIRLDVGARVACVVLIVTIVAMGVAPSAIIDTIAESVQWVTLAAR
jgi:NADH-quinone oxidoreductase subunit N